MIFSKQQRLVEGSLCGFRYKGEAYLTTNYAKTKQLHPTLHEEMQSYLKNAQEIAVESQYIKSYLTAVFNLFPINQAHHFLPPTLHPLLKNKGIIQNPERPEDVSTLFKFNQKGYDLLLQRILFNTVGV